jgi:predicted HTH transcriptional regulator
MVAFANSEGGRIIIGVGNGGQMVGLSRPDVDQINQLISSAASQHVRSSLSPLTENVAVGKGRL